MTYTCWIQKTRFAAAAVAIHAFSILRPEAVSAQSRLDFPEINLITGAGPQVQTQRVALDRVVGIPSPQLEFRVGFSTDESSRISRILDLFTGTLVDASGRLNLPLFTFDAQGVVVLPHVLGSIPMNASQAQVSPIDWPVEWVQQRSVVRAFEVRIPIPVQLDWEHLGVVGTLFDNRNEESSQAWISPIQVVPEPSWLAAGLAGMAWIGFRNYCGRRPMRCADSGEPASCE